MKLATDSSNAFYSLNSLTDSDFGRQTLIAFTTCLSLLALIGVCDARQRSVPDARRDRPQQIANPAVLEMHGEIDGKLTTYFRNRFERARHEGVDLLIVEIDSPGGLKNESLEMARMLRDCDWAYTVALIRNEAISGGALLSLGCDEIFIDPNAKYGDIGEIAFDAEQFAWRLIEPKIESYLSRDARDLAESKGRPADLAEAMVDKDVMVYRKPVAEEADNAAEAINGFQFQLVRTDATDKPVAPWELIPETGPERFLTLSGQRAKELGIAQQLGGDLNVVAEAFQFDRDRVKRFRYTGTDTFVYYLNTPFFTGVLMLIGLIALYSELSAPGIGVGGLLSGVCAMLFFWSRFLSGTSGWLEVMLFVAGIVCLLLELFVIPGFGLPGFLGLVLIFCSVVLASQNFVVPETAMQWNHLITSLLVILCSGMLFIIAAVFISRRLGTLPVFNRLVLAADADRAIICHGDSSVQPEATRLNDVMVAVGDQGVAESVLRPAGVARFGDRIIDVISDGSYVESGSQVRVIRINGNVVKVMQVEPS